MVTLHPCAICTSGLHCNVHLWMVLILSYDLHYLVQHCVAIAHIEGHHPSTKNSSALFSNAGSPPSTALEWFLPLLSTAQLPPRSLFAAKFTTRRPSPHYTPISHSNALAIMRTTMMVMLRLTRFLQWWTIFTEPAAKKRNIGWKRDIWMTACWPLWQDHLRCNIKRDLRPFVMQIICRRLTFPSLVCSLLFTFSLTKLLSSAFLCDCFIFSFSWIDLV